MIDVKNLAAISGVGGILKIVTARKDGVIAEDITKGTKNFYPQRSHTFSPFEAISIYTTSESVTIAQVFSIMLEKFEETPPVSDKSDSNTLRKYFLQILPDHDTDKVQISDIKKIIRWFNFLKTHDLLKEKVEEVKAEASTTTQIEYAEEPPVAKTGTVIAEDENLATNVEN